jgi:membrane-bound metal-dependent hydrolase YbcI (DUF457 family)
VEPGRAIASKSFDYGFVSGSVLPDVDLAALAAMYVFDPGKAMRMHRTATHSLVIVGLATALGVLLSTTRGGKSYFRGLGLGMALHSFVDVFLWLSGIDILWPLGHLGLPSQVNLWTNVKIPPLWNNFLGAADFLMLALFYMTLIGLSRRYETNYRFVPTLRAFTVLHWVGFAAYVGLSFFLSRTLFDIALYAVIVLVSLPMTWIAIVKSRPSLERLGASTVGYGGL